MIFYLLFLITEDSNYEVYTVKDEKRFDQLVLTTEANSFVFEVKACSDVHLALSRVPGVTTSQSYEVVIGGWNGNMSLIRDGIDGQSLIERVWTVGILNCSEFRPFWVSWTNSNITVGTGRNVTSGMFMSAQTSNPWRIGAVSISTGYGYDGRYRILRDQGQSETTFTIGAKVSINKLGDM